MLVSLVALGFESADDDRKLALALKFRDPFAIVVEVEESEPIASLFVTLSLVEFVGVADVVVVVVDEDDDDSDLHFSAAAAAATESPVACD